jgi:hypothetical protein
VSLQRLHNPLRLVAGVYADGASRLLAPDDARVLLKSCDCDFLYEHLGVNIVSGDGL